ncbi:hypothetical protein BpHYR1_009610 [Brachionus plicatilis]|uniref:Uncharacterized protein n=1 Tax=Brachionus plicatilis TaxID=10195 RepID=A0A3M7T5X7_BRAPC|nr:hypothetical protein BpHYR1_009610 [Brachionus plicatilis]
MRKKNYYFHPNILNCFSYKFQKFNSKKSHFLVYNFFVKFKSDTNFISNLDYGNESTKKSNPAWHDETKQIPGGKKLNKKSSQLQQKSATSIHMFSGISKPLIKMNSKLKFRSKSSTQLVDEACGPSVTNLADSLQNPEKDQLECIESKEESESDKGECRRKTSVLHGFYANNYQLYHNLNSHSRNQKRYSSSANDAYSNLNQNSNVKSIATNLSFRDIVEKAFWLIGIKYFLLIKT